MNLSNQVAIITGSSRGIGRAIALKLANTGVKLTINYLHSEKEAKELLDEINKSGGQAIAIKADVAQVDNVRVLAEETWKHFARC